MPFGDEGIGSVNISDWMGATVVAGHASLLATSQITGFVS